MRLFKKFTKSAFPSIAVRRVRRARGAVHGAVGSGGQRAERHHRRRHQQPPHSGRCTDTATCRWFIHTFLTYSGLKQNSVYLFLADLRPRGPLQVPVRGVREARRATALPEPRRRRQAVRRHRRHREEPHAPGEQDAYTQCGLWGKGNKGEYSIFQRHRSLPVLMNKLGQYQNFHDVP